MKKKNKFMHVVKLIFSKSYRRQFIIARGESIWNNLDKQLPLAHGGKEDKERLELFRQETKKLSTFKYYALETYLTARIAEYRKNILDPHWSGDTAEIQRKLDIYWDHYMAMIQF